jgi:multiple sugar transport system ATP-binding protein
VGTPSEVYLYPANLFVAQFIGSPVMNISATTVSDAGGRAQVAIDRETFELPGELLGMLQSKKASNELSLGVRPEGVLVSREQQPGYKPVEAHLIQPYGGFDIVDLKIGEQTLRARTASGFVRDAGQTVFAAIDPAHAHFFDTKSGASLDIRLGN